MNLIINIICTFLTIFNIQNLSKTISSNKDFIRRINIQLFFCTYGCLLKYLLSIESNIAYIMILTVGILHGSNDIMLVNHSLRSNSNISSFSIFVIYVTLVASVAILFYFVPFVALCLFVIFSSYHFGEQHFISKTKTTNSLLYFYYTSYGMLIFSMIFFSSPR